MTKIDIISGFLGAGKTTFIKKMIDEGFTGEKLVLIENEFGEVGIDGGFLKDAGIQITEMNSGCICCSLVGDFGRNLHEVIGKYHPDRILIEPSGVGKLSDVMKSVIDVEKEEDVKLNGLITVVNALKASKQMKAFGEFFNNQIEYATTVVLSRSQNATPEQLELCVKQIQSINDKAAIITTPWDDISGETILAAMQDDHSLAEDMLATVMAEHDDDDDDDDDDECCHHHHDHDEHDECCHHHHDHDEHEHHHDHDEHDHEHDEHDHDHCCGHHHHHHHADEVFTSWGTETPRKYTDDEIRTALDALINEHRYGVVLRAKGIVPATDGGWIHFDYVPGESDVRRGSAQVTGRVCVIGSHLAEDALKELFHIG